MHWGLTTFERKRIERIALDHPYFDMHAPLLTKKELHTILAQGPRKTGPQVIAEVKNELGIAHAPETQEKRTFAEALRDASFVPSFRRTVILSVFCLLLVLFMTFTVPGRAFAEEIYSIIVGFVNNSLYARNTSSLTSQKDSDFSSLPVDVGSPQDLAVLLNDPIVITNDKMVSFYYTLIDSQSLVIRSKYEYKNGKMYVLIQGIHRDDAIWGYGADGYEETTQVQTSIDVTMYGGILSDGTNIFSGFAPQSTIQISSKQLTLSELAEIVRGLQYVSIR